MILRAVIEKLKTDDGLIEFMSSVQIGKTYLVDTETIRRGQTMINTELMGVAIPHTKDIIFTVDGVWLPLDLLRLIP